MNTEAKPIWNDLEAAHRPWLTASLRALFDADPKRAERYQLSVGDWFFDYSKNLVDDEVLVKLCSLAKASGVEAARDAMFAGEKINATEGRSVLNTALRLPRSASLLVDGVDVVKGCARSVGSLLRTLRLGCSGRCVERVYREAD